MSLDTTTEEKNILARVRANAVGGRVHEMLPDEEQIERDPITGMVKPYIILTFGEVFPLGTDRSILGAAEQPHVLPIIGECWGATVNEARGAAVALRLLFTGWAPSADNASEIELSGGGRFTSYDRGRPVRYMRSVAASCVINMSIHDDTVPAP